jgi:CRISPR-associated Csx14 family protein
MTDRIEVLCCYAQEDEKLLERLKKYLKLLERECLISVWSKSDTMLGSKPEQEFEKHLKTAKIILLLVSPDFMASEDCYNKEMKPALERSEAEEAVVIPILLHPIDWENAPFSQLQCLPRDGKPVKNGRSLNQALLDVAKGIRNVVDDLIKQSVTILPPEPSQTESEARDEQNQGIETVHQRKTQTVLIATLGESPVVVTSMFDWFIQEGIAPVSVVEVLCSDADNVNLGYRLIEKVLQERCDLRPIPLKFNDASGLEESYDFLQTLARLLKSHQEAGNTVYLSLAGGRKNMSALMAILAPLYSCVKGLYHILDKNEHKPGCSLLSVEELYKLHDSPYTDWKAFMLFDPERLLPVKIPYETQPALAEFFAHRRNFTKELLEKRWDIAPEEAEILTYYAPLINGTEERLLKLEITEEAYQQYQNMLISDPDRAREFRKCFRQMRYRNRLGKIADGGEETGSYKRFPLKEERLAFHFYKRRGTVERPFFHTERDDVYAKLLGEVQKVIISHLAIEQDGRYSLSGKEFVKSLKFPLDKRALPLQALEENKALALEEQNPSLAKSILVVPLGESPMIATQLYTLLLEQEYEIHKVVLLYPDPDLSREIRLSSRLAEAAFKAKEINYEMVYLKGWGDIDSTEACSAYQKKLEETLERLQIESPEYQIVLALSGGRKGMAALAMFAAQQREIHFVYHTLITDEDLYDRVTKETELNVLDELSDETLQKRLFLDAYTKEECEKFEVFKVPVIPLQFKHDEPQSTDQGNEQA